MYGIWKKFAEMKNMVRLYCMKSLNHLYKYYNNLST